MSVNGTGTLSVPVTGGDGTINAYLYDADVWAGPISTCGLGQEVNVMGVAQGTLDALVCPISAGAAVSIGFVLPIPQVRELAARALRSPSRRALTVTGTPLRAAPPAGGGRPRHPSHHRREQQHRHARAGGPVPQRACARGVGVGGGVGGAHGCSTTKSLTATPPFFSTADDHPVSVGRDGRVRVPCAGAGE